MNYTCTLAILVHHRRHSKKCSSNWLIREKERTSKFGLENVRRTNLGGITVVYKYYCDVLGLLETGFIQTIKSLYTKCCSFKKTVLSSSKLHRFYQYSEDDFCS